METLEKVIEVFYGRVNMIEGEIASVSLYDSKKNESYAEIEITKLQAPEGVIVKEGYQFKMEVVEVNEEASLRFTYIPRRKLTDKDYREVQEELKKEIPNEWVDY